VRLALLASIVAQLALTPVLLGQPRSADPDVNARALAEVLLGGAGAALGAYMGAVIGAGTIGPQEGEDAGLLGLVIGGIIGTPVGAATGAYLGARAVDAKPKFATALGGAGLGMAGFLFVRPAARLDPDQAPFWICFLGMPVAGAVLFEEIDIRNHRVQLQIVPRKDGLMLGARVGL
jgi:hypothetical protein